MPAATKSLFASNFKYSLCLLMANEFRNWINIRRVERRPSGAYIKRNKNRMKPINIGKNAIVLIKKVILLFFLWFFLAKGHKEIYVLKLFAQLYILSSLAKQKMFNIEFWCFFVSFCIFLYEYF
jgi:hypothetical protein